MLKMVRLQPPGKEVYLFLDRPIFSNESLHSAYGMQRGGVVSIEASANGLEGFACIAPRQIHGDLPRLGNAALTGPGQEFFHGELVVLAHEFLNTFYGNLSRPSYNVLYNTFGQFSVNGEIQQRSLNSDPDQSAFKLPHILGELTRQIMDDVF